MSKNNLKKYRLKSNLTQKQVAKILNITETGYQNYELGYRNIPYDKLKLVCSLFNCTSTDILGF
ncbi:Helix-turn-helix [Peptostreptococcus anaerobius]|uniref:Helix-turn-helix n=1 Tax=Peptostreptococcus anaerobius TaxID=1261 RepID=A0A379C6X8_9FIRM|nr:MULTISPECIES: helix-turn-helix transcriptional regulator [Peptostreptococcus]MDU5350513.1 helix-turn-helix transcriptional regulator [Peptostreptococcus sp.]MDU5892002.1 helix-turn-helix transcriptional regulator [Peptostreptococcus sp.]SFN17501.1 Helix-turn-helix [Peptostreptococcus anaerobius]SUB57993.1 Helix-turn-helix [Peptostreptococcus anaerobius]SUB62077.1 Helix-turn-helix [Peptostreptococcus anaerobius]